MRDDEKTKEQLIDELNEMRRRIAEFETCAVKLFPLISGIIGGDAAIDCLAEIDVDDVLKERLSNLNPVMEIGATEGKNHGEFRKSLDVLLHSAEEYFDLYNNAPNAFFSISTDGNIIRVNPRAGILLGIPHQDLIGKPIFDFYADTPTGKQKALTVFSRFKAGEDILDEELEMQRLGGDLVWISLTVNAVRDASGQITESRSMVVDITERKRMEDELRISEEKFCKAFHLNPDAITITRLVDGMFVSVNEGFKHLSGYPEEEVIGKTSLELNILDNPEDRNRLIEVLKAEGKVDNFEAGFRIKNGDVRYGLMSASIIELNGVEHILNVTRDITERKLTEEQLRESEEKYRLLTENMNDVIWQTTPDMVFTYVSPSIKEQRGYDTNEVLGRQIWDFIAPNEILSWRKRVKQPFNLLLSRETAFETEPYELHVRKDGTTLWTETMATPVINHEGNLIAFQGVTRDITERKQLEEALRNTLGRYHTILSSLYAGVLVVGVDGRVEFANQAFCDLFHLEDLPENLRGLSSPAMIQKIKDVYAQPADTVSRIQAIVAHGDPVKGEEIAMRDGRVYTVDFVPIHIDGKPYGRLWHHQDITERKLLEDRLRQEIVEREKSG